MKNMTQRLLVTVLAMASPIIAGNSASAFDLKPSEIRGKSSKEPITVLQNRYFLKAYRPEFGLSYGQVLDEAYLKTAFVGARAGLFFNEWLGFEVQVAKTDVQDSDDRIALNRLRYRPLNDNSANVAVDGNTTTTTETFVTPDPEVNAVYGMADVNVVAAPFYGKLNLADTLIVYTDLYLTAGLAAVDTDQGKKASITVGGGERFYVGRGLSLRIDLKDRIYDEKRAGQETIKHSVSVDVGASYFFN